MNEQQPLVPTFGGAEARRRTDALKRDAEALWRNLIELYEGGAHSALNYDSWHEYCASEFGFGRSHSYRLLDAGRVSRAIPPRGNGNALASRASLSSTGTDVSINERQARELVPLLRAEDEDAVIEVFSELKAEYGERLTAVDVREAVEKKLKPKPPRTASPPVGDQLAAARADLSLAYGRAARLVIEWFEEHPEFPDEERERVYRTVAPQGWQELKARVQCENGGGAR